MQKAPEISKPGKQSVNIAMLVIWKPFLMLEVGLRLERLQKLVIRTR